MGASISPRDGGGGKRRRGHAKNRPMAEGKIVLQNIEIKNENLIEKLVAVAEERTNNKVFLRADASVNYAAVMEVMGALNAAGFNNIGLVTDAGGPKLDGSDP